jgi:hypothetical protein
MQASYFIMMFELCLQKIILLGVCRSKIGTGGLKVFFIIMPQ